MKTVSQYQITWVEIKAEKGFVTMADQKKLEEIKPTPRRERVWRAFRNKERAEAWVAGLNRNLSKTYICRFCTDKQFGLQDENGNIPYTKKQLAETIIL